jgi:ribosomal protein L37AE/L43A
VEEPEAGTSEPEVKPDEPSGGTQVEPEVIPKEEEKKPEEEERDCPTCGTMISKQASTCFACGADVEPVMGEKKETEPEVPTKLEPAPELESTVELEPKREVIVPSKDELYTLSDDQLVELCNSLGLDSSGRSKHLRERLLKYIEGQQEEGEKEPEKAEEGKSCPDCGGDLTYVEQYDAWYCSACEKYAPNPEDG